MGTNAYQSLQTIQQAFTAVSFNVAQLGKPEATAKYRADLQRARGQALVNLEHLTSEQLDLIGIPLFEFFADCALTTAIASAMQRALSEQLQGHSRSFGLPQESTHLLVDLWGQIEASKALFDFSARQIGEAMAQQGDRSVKGVSLRAQCRVLAVGLEQVLLTLAMKFGEYLSLSSVAELTDWGVQLLRAKSYEPLREALNEELYGLVA